MIQCTNAPNTECTGPWGLPLRGVRHLRRAFRVAWLRVFSALKQNPRPPQLQFPYKANRGRKPLGIQRNNDD